MIEQAISFTVKFPDGFPASEEGPMLLRIEKMLREATGKDCRVFKDKMGDDSKLRIRMTAAERARL